MVRKAFLVLVLAIALAGATPGQATPAGRIIRVDTTGDDLLANGNCTLREALLAANTDHPVDACLAGSEMDLVLLPAGEFSFAIEGMDEDGGLAGDLDITSSLVLRGAGQDRTVITAGLMDRVVDVLPGSQRVRMEDLTLKDGSLGYEEVEGDYTPSFGAGLRNQAGLELARVTVLCPGIDSVGYDVHGVGISNLGRLRMENSTVRGSRAGYATGGGIYNQGDMVITNSAITDNYVETGPGPGIYNTGRALIQNTNLNWNRQDVYDNTEGGNIYNSGDFTCETCSILGGVGYPGAVILNGGRMALADTQVAYGTTRYAYGEAIYSSGSLSLERSKVFDSTMRGILGGGELTIIDSEFANHRVTTWANYPDYGGGAINFDGTVFISGTLFKDNLAGARGGAIEGSGQWVIEGSAFTGNQAVEYSPDWDISFETGLGGGIYWRGGSLSITNTTFSGNRAADGGPAVFVQAGEASMNSVTIAQNESTGLSGGGGLAVLNGQVTLFNSLIAQNLERDAPDCFQFPADPLTGEPASGQILSVGYNLVGVADACGLAPAAGDQLGTAAAPLDPRLAPLGNYGGLTPTHALLPGSPALDRGAVQNCPAKDQRGVPRPQGPACDTGAYELEQP